MICKGYLHTSLITLINRTNKCIQNRRNLMPLNNSAYCCQYDGHSSRPNHSSYHGPKNVLLMPNKPLFVPRLHLKQTVAVGAHVHYSTSKGLSLKDEDYDKEQQMKGKFFPENESLFHHKVMEESSSYSSTIFKSSPEFSDRYMISEEEFNKLLSISDWESESPHDIAAAFISFGLYSSRSLNVNMEDDRFNKMVDAFEKNCSSFTDDQIIDCLIAIQIWPQSDHVKAVNFLRVWKILDKVCYERIPDWSHDKILFVMDLWYQIRLVRLNNFTFHGLKKISRRCKDLTSAQMVQIFFYMSCVRKLHPAISMRDYEHYVQKHITHFSIGEIGILALAFFKTTMIILNQKLLVYMMHRVLEEIDTIHPITLTAITKTLRLSHKPEIGFTVNDFVKELSEKRMDSLSLVNAVHILHISTQVQFFNEESITKLAEKFCKDPSEARLKDMERVMFILSLFNYIPPSTPNLLDIMLDQLEKPQHVTAGKDHPLVLFSLLYYLTLFRAYGEKQIHEVLDEGSLKQKYDSQFVIPVQVLQIDYNRVLEGPPGSTHLLSPTLREYLSRRYSKFIPDDKRQYKAKYEQMFLEVLKLTKELLGGEEYAMPAYLLPHFPRADIIFHLDEGGNPLPIPEDLRNRPNYEGVLRPPDEKGWYAVFLGGRNMYMHNTPRLVGEQVTKLRQLRLLGYTTITIPNHYWIGEKNKIEYLKLKYFTKSD